MSDLAADVRDRLSAAKLWLVSSDSPTTCGDMPYLATAVCALVTVPTPRVARMSVDRRWRLYANPAWVLAADVPVIAAELAHLVWHLLAEHDARAADVDVRNSTAEAWRLATDVTVAELLDDLATGLPRADEHELPTGRAAEEYYARLTDLPVTVASDPDGDPGDDTPIGAESGEEAGADDRCGSGCDGLPRDYELSTSAEVGGVGEADVDEIRRRVAIEFREHQTAAGTRPGEWSRWVESILDPVVPWHQVLAATVRGGVAWAHGHTDYTYTRISRRQAAAGPVILPATRRPVPEVAVVVDTSGSVDDGLLSRALGEVQGVLASMGAGDRSVTVLAVDAAVAAVSRVRRAPDVHLAGGGGTDMGVGIGAAVDLRPRPGLVIVVTDGYTPWPSDPPPVAIIVALVGRDRTELPPTPPWAHRVECVS